MDVLWKNSEPLLRKLDCPSYGSKESWMRWYEEAWVHMSKSGLTRVRTPLDETVVRLRILALCWLSHDFCGAVLQSQWSSSPYWSEWIDHLEIDPLSALLTGLDEELINGIVCESELTSTDHIDDDEEAFVSDYSEITNDLLPRFAMAAAYIQRDTVIDALLQGFGGVSPLFMSMYANCCSIEDVIDERRELLEEELGDLEEKYEQLSTEEEMRQLQKSMEILHEQLDKEALIQSAVEELQVRAANAPIYFGDEESGERMNGYQWCSEACPVVVRGEPEFYLP